MRAWKKAAAGVRAWGGQARPRPRASLRKQGCGSRRAWRKAGRPCCSAAPRRSPSRCPGRGGAVAVDYSGPPDRGRAAGGRGRAGTGPRRRASESPELLLSGGPGSRVSRKARGGSASRRGTPFDPARLAPPPRASRASEWAGELPGPPAARRHPWRVAGTGAPRLHHTPGSGGRAPSHELARQS